MTAKYLICLFVLSISFLSCKKKERSNTIVSMTYQVFDSCQIYSFWTPTIPAGGNSRGKRYKSSHTEIVSFDISDPSKYILRGEAFTQNDRSSSVFSKYDSKQFDLGLDGAPETKLTFKGDSLFISSTASLKYSTSGYELRAIRK